MRIWRKQRGKGISQGVPDWWAMKPEFIQIQTKSSYLISHSLGAVIMVHALRVHLSRDLCITHITQTLWPWEESLLPLHNLIHDLWYEAPKSIFQPEIYLYLSPTRLPRTKEKGQRDLEFLGTIVNTSDHPRVNTPGDFRGIKEGT